MNERMMVLALYLSSRPDLDNLPPIFGVDCMAHGSKNSWKLLDLNWEQERAWTVFTITIFLDWIYALSCLSLFAV